MNGRRTAVFRQQRAMKVDGIVWRELYQPWWQYPAIGNNDDHLGRERLKQRTSFVILERFRLINRKVQIERFVFDRRALHGLMAASGFVGLCDHAANGVPLVEKPFQRGNRKGCGPHEDESYSHFPSRINFLILRLMRSRLRKLR